VNVALPAAPVGAAVVLAAGFARTAAEHDRSGRFPRDDITALHAQGLLALTVPRRFGGGEAGLAQAVAVITAIARGEPATALVLAMQTVQHASLARGRSWPADVYARVARSAVEDGALINALRVEPELGTPARGGLPATIARRTADGWRISGRKTFCTGIPVLTWLSVWARTDEAVPRVGNFLVPSNAPGIAVEATWDQAGMRATESHDVVFDAVAIPDAFAVDVRAPADWTGPDPQTGAWNACIVSAVYHGVALAARDWLAGWLQARVPSNLGAPLATVPRIQAAYGEIEGLLRLDARLLHAAAEAVDRDGGAALASDEAGLLKQRICADAIDAVQRALALTGNAGLARRNPLERHLRDVLCARIHTPQDDSVFLAAGRAALAVPPGVAA
jgi:alkylation response protein AidB-like acyl-CoA dehydrogenase